VSPALSAGTAQRPLPVRLNARRRLRRIAWIVALSCATPIAISFTAAISGPSNSSFTIRAFEWLRDNGAAKIASGADREGE